MGKIIVIAGNSGVGKTTLTAALSAARPLATGLEQHVERPFQALMAADPRAYALANQVDIRRFALKRRIAERPVRVIKPKAPVAETATADAEAGSQTQADEADAGADE